MDPVTFKGFWSFDGNNCHAVISGGNYCRCLGHTGSWQLDAIYTLRVGNYNNFLTEKIIAPCA
jgi:hypothetical protein